MAAPHVAGSVALLRQRHPTWTPAQLKSALATTGDRAFQDEGRTTEATSTREGGGVVNLLRADRPLLFTSPAALSFGLVQATATATLPLTLSDAGGGAGDWTATVEQQTGAARTTISVPPAATVPGTLPVTVSTAGAPSGELSGFVVLTRGAERRRVPYWLRVSAPSLGGAKTTPLRRPGTYKSNTRGGTTLVSRYRYPESPRGLGFATSLPGPERVFRVNLAGAVANFGVVVTSRAKGVVVEPRIVKAGDENRLTGYPALPFNLNPYLRTFQEPVPAAGAILPARGAYDVVFDSPSRARAGAFTFRFWIADTKPPALRLRTRTVRRGQALVVAASDAGSGVEPRSIVARIDGRETESRAQKGRILVRTAGLGPGGHTLVLQVSDYQETRNMENVARILPNTRILGARFTVR